MDDVLAGLRAAAEPTRLRLLSICAYAELTVTELTQILGQSQPRVSRHLKLLCDAGLLNRFREGTWAFYRLAEDGPCAELARTLIDLLSEDDPVLALDLERLQAVKAARAKAAADYFRSNAGHWDEIRSLYVPEAEVEAGLEQLLGDEEIGDFIDIGTGTGRILEVFAPHIRRGVGIDLSHEMLRVARARLEQSEIRNCQVRHGDFYNLSVPTASFDVAVVHQVLHYAEEPGAAIAEAARVLRPGGRLLVVDFAAHRETFLQSEHRHLRLGFDDSEVARWFLAAGLASGPALKLEGEPLTVMIWQARRPGVTPSREPGLRQAANG
jgi:ubiquinone/menaquinone biosynthesis C-methylase UbiE/DNA-binding transcriptional ArsR family regulator